MNFLFVIRKIKTDIFYDSLALIVIRNMILLFYDFHEINHGSFFLFFNLTDIDGKGVRTDFHEKSWFFIYLYLIVMGHERWDTYRFKNHKDKEKKSRIALKS